MSNKQEQEQEIKKKVREIRKFAKQNANLLGYDVEAYVENALKQLGIEQQ